MTSLTWQQLRAWALAQLSFRLPAVPNQTVIELLDLEPAGSGNPRTYTERHQRVVAAHVRWTRLVDSLRGKAGGSTHFATVRDWVRQIASEHRSGAVVVIDGVIGWTDNPEQFLRDSLSTPYGFGAIPCDLPQ